MGSRHHKTPPEAFGSQESLETYLEQRRTAYSKRLVAIGDFKRTEFSVPPGSLRFRWDARVSELAASEDCEPIQLLVDDLARCLALYDLSIARQKAAESFGEIVLEKALDESEHAFSRAITGLEGVQTVAQEVLTHTERRQISEAARRLAELKQMTQQRMRRAIEHFVNAKLPVVDNGRPVRDLVVRIAQLLRTYTNLSQENQAKVIEEIATELGISGGPLGSLPRFLKKERFEAALSELEQRE